MIRLPSFGDQVINLLWDRNYFRNTNLSPSESMNMTSLSTRDYAGSMCSMLEMSFRSITGDDENMSAALLADHASPATIGT